MINTLICDQNLWDCGGQNAFIDNYLTAQKDTIFANVAVLIYVFDITSTEWDTDLKYFEDMLATLRENSVDAGVWVLVNKMDLMDKEDPTRKRFEQRRGDMVAADERVSQGKKSRGALRCFPTSIWDESLYKVGPSDNRGWTDCSGLVVCRSHSNTQYQLDHLASHLSTRPMSGRRSCSIRSRDISRHCQIWLSSRFPSLRTGQTRNQRRGKGIRSATIREDLRDRQGFPQALPVRFFQLT